MRWFTALVEGERQALQLVALQAASQAALFNTRDDVWLLASSATVQGRGLWSFAFSPPPRFTEDRLPMIDPPRSILEMIVEAPGASGVARTALSTLFGIPEASGAYWASSPFRSAFFLAHEDLSGLYAWARFQANKVVALDAAVGAIGPGCLSFRDGGFRWLDAAPLNPADDGFRREFGGDYVDALDQFYDRGPHLAYPVLSAGRRAQHHIPSEFVEG